MKAISECKWIVEAVNIGGLWFWKARTRDIIGLTITNDYFSNEEEVIENFIAFAKLNNITNYEIKK